MLYHPIWMNALCYGRICIGLWMRCKTFVEEFINDTPLGMVDTACLRGALQTVLYEALHHVLMLRPHRVLHLKV